jgi:hypothetical protein
MNNSKCRNEEYITGLIDGELNWLRRRLVRRHLRRCSSCKEIYESVTPITGALSSETELGDAESGRVWRGIENSLIREHSSRRNWLVALRPVLAPAATIALGLVVVFAVRFAMIEQEPEQTEDCIVEYVRSDYDEAVPFYYQPSDGPTVIWVFERTGDNGAEIVDES